MKMFMEDLYGGIYHFLGAVFLIAYFITSRQMSDAEHNIVAKYTSVEILSRER